MVALVVITTARFFSAAAFGADESSIRIPEGFRGTWLLRLTSDDGGKTYRSGGGKAVCEASATEIKFTQKVDFSDERLVVKSVTKSDGNGTEIWLIGFENAKVWKLYDLGGSITAIIHDDDNGKLTETFRITVRKQEK